MNYAELILDAQTLLGDISPGSMRFSQYPEALQWAQEQACTLLGLSYVEALTAWSGVTGPTSEVVSTLTSPADAISVDRVLLYNSDLTPIGVTG